MSPNAANVIEQVNKYIRNYAPDAFSDFNLNRILILITQLADANGGGGPVASGQYKFRSADFVDPGSGKKTDVVAPILLGFDLSVFVNQYQRYLDPDTEFSLLAGGGFRILVPGFDASTDNFLVYATIL